MEKTYIGNAVLDHGESLDTKAECEALILRRIDAGVLKHIRMHHARTHDLQPFLLSREPYVHFHRGFSEREVTRPKTYLRLLTKKLLTESVECTLQMSERDIGIDGKSFELIELCLMRRI